MDAITATCVKGRGEFLVGLIDDVIVAMGALRPITQNVGAIKRIRVHPDCQRQGLGQQILVSLEISARSLGYDQLELDTLRTQVAAVRFFQKQGYQIKGTRQFENHEQLLLMKRFDDVKQQRY